MIGREWAARVQKIPSGTVVVENMGGGGGTIGAATAARAPADGHTLFLGSTSELVLVPILGQAQLRCRVKDFTPISIMTVSVGAIVVHPSVPANNLKELVAYAKANPGKLNYGSAGTGSSSNLTGELFKHLAGVPDIVHIPYKGATPGLTDLVAGQVPIFTPMISGNIVELHNAGKVRILASASEQRMAASPNIPTAAEQGYPDLVSELFIGLFAPTGTPQPVIDQLVKATGDVTREKQWQAKLITAGFEPVVDSNPEKASKYLKAEVARWTPVLKDSGLAMSQ